MDINYFKPTQQFARTNPTTVAYVNCTPIHFCNVCRKNENLPYTSNFVEKLGFFPKITHANWLAPLGVSNLNLCLTKEILHDYNIKNLMFSFQTPNSVSKRLVLNPYQMEIHLPSMISSFKKSVSIFKSYVDIRMLCFKKYMKNVSSYAFIFINTFYFI